MASATAGYFRRLTRKLTEDVQDRDDEQMARESRDHGAVAAASCQRGEEVTLLGRLRGIENAPGGAAKVKADFYDGTDEIKLVWIGRRKIPGLEAGRKIRVTGRVGEWEGRKVMFNPVYELQEEG